MQKFNEIVSKLPILTVWYWLFCAIFLVDTKFYLENFKLLDTIDSILVFLFGLHFVFFRRVYSKCSKVYLQCIYTIILLNFCYFYLTEIIYYYLYYSIIITYIIISFWKIAK